MNGAWTLPQAAEHALLFAQLAETVRAQGGTATVFSTETNLAEGEDLVARFRGERAKEYGEFSQRAAAFLAEIDQESKQGKFTFAELEELEDELQRLTTWLDKIRARDFFPDSESEKAAGALASSERAFRSFAQHVYEHEGVADSSDEEC